MCWPPPCQNLCTRQAEAAESQKMGGGAANCLLSLFHAEIRMSGCISQVNVLECWPLWIQLCGAGFPTEKLQLRQLQFQVLDKGKVKPVTWPENLRAEVKVGPMVVSLKGQVFSVLPLAVGPGHHVFLHVKTCNSQMVVWRTCLPQRKTTYLELILLCYRFTITRYPGGLPF